MYKFQKWELCSQYVLPSMVQFCVFSFSLGSLGSEDDEDEQRARIRDRSAESDGHVKPIGRFCQRLLLLHSNLYSFTQASWILNDGIFNLLTRFLVSYKLLTLC